MFVRATPRDSVDTARGRAQAGSLWVVRTDGRGARELVRARASDDPRRVLAGFRSPQFAPDGREVYFLVSAWATSDAVHAVDVATGAVRFVAPGNDLRVVPAGEYAGHLVVAQHRYFLGGGSYDWYWLLTPAGAGVGPVGETEESVRRFLEERAPG